MSIFLPSLIQHKKNKENFDHKKEDVIFQQDDILLPDTLNQLVSDSFNNLKKEENILKEELILSDSPEFFEFNIKDTNASNSNILNEISIDEEKDLTQLSKVELSRALVDLIVRNSESTVQTPAKKRKIENKFGKELSLNTSYIENNLPTSISIKKCTLNVNSEKETRAVSQLTLDNLSKPEENHNQREVEFTTVDNSKKATSQKNQTSYYYCNSCNFQQLERYLIIQHIEKKHPKMLEKHSGDEKKAFTIISEKKNENIEKWFAVYCGKCNKKYQRSSFHGIEKICCNQQMIYICGKCGIRYKCRKTMYNHMHKISCVPDHYFQCQSCNYVTFKKMDLQWHHWKKHLSNDAKTKNTKKLLKQYCNKCHMIYESEKSVDAIKKCLECREGLVRKSCRERVFPNTDWSIIYCCNSCNYRTKRSQSYMQFHIWVKHENGYQNYNEPQKVSDYFRTFCFHCNRICGPVVLERTCQMCNRQTMYTCSSPSCDVGYSRQASLHAHVNNKHLTGHPHRRSIQFTDVERLRVHKSTKSSCDFTSSSVNDLSKHNARTVCELCQKKFHNSKGLLVHQLTRCSTVKHPEKM